MRRKTNTADDTDVAVQKQLTKKVKAKTVDYVSMFRECLTSPPKPSIPSKRQQKQLEDLTDMNSLFLPVSAVQPATSLALNMVKPISSENLPHPISNALPTNQQKALRHDCGGSEQRAPLSLSPLSAPMPLAALPSLQRIIQQRADVIAASSTHSTDVTSLPTIAALTCSTDSQPLSLVSQPNLVQPINVNLELFASLPSAALFDMQQMRVTADGVIQAFSSAADASQR